MGHRANFIVIENGPARAYCDQWAAMGCLDLLRAGPDTSAEVLADFEQTSELMDWAFAEGGYLLDKDDRTAILFGSLEADFEYDEFGTATPSNQSLALSRTIGVS